MSGELVNDLHSQLNPTTVERIAPVDSLESIQAAIAAAQREGKSLSIAGGRHAMGAQQFGTDTVLLDTVPMNRVLDFDAEAGLITVEAGIYWPELIAACRQAGAAHAQKWAIAQKQTGGDRMSIGGALAANVHGRGLSMRPIITDVESFVLVDADGHVRNCSRNENADLFRLVIGGYGLFGVVYSITLRLVPLQKLRRAVSVIDIEELMSAFEQRIEEGFLYGDFQYSIDDSSVNYLTRGVFSCYRPISMDTPIPSDQVELSVDDWRRLILYAHANKPQAFEEYVAHYLATDGQIYWSDLHQLGYYEENYHRMLDQHLRAPAPATEVITEIYVPRNVLAQFMYAVREDFRRHKTEVVYGTIRLVERDEESFLAWARESFACIIFNLHVSHTSEGKEHAAASFRRLIDRAIQYGGSYYLTYHRHATRAQVEQCYPQFPEFIRQKRRYDPDERIQSDWYRHYTTMFSDATS
ncbi:MAG: FAD-binding oxidoreductase [Chloroflexota bacterium]|nr:FAD-binding oxidoreductase [Chloroflexota bacterium]MDE2930043.1 FAD-binding oxidoreductase [Chloroflexota bacterium]